MALAARPNPAEARVPCPVCRALIHPIAGRCKHCKSDLSAARASRPPAMMALPALHALPAAAPYQGTGHAAAAASYARAPSAAPAPANGHEHVELPASAPAPLRVPEVASAPVAYDPTRAVLPPRPTGRHPIATHRTPWWQSWPLVVVIVAGSAITIAVVLLVLPPSKASAGEIKLKNGAPAPERMDTAPIEPSPDRPDRKDPRAADPWKKPPGAPPATPDIDIPDDPADDPAGANTLSGTDATMMAMMRHACDRAAACGKTDNLADYCEMVGKLKAAPPPTCAAAVRCVAAIDKLDCDGEFDDVSALSSVMYKLQDCVAALSC
jgi:hypothetical protein